MPSPPETSKSPRSSKDPESPKSTGSNAAEGSTGVGILPASHWQEASQDDDVGDNSDADSTTGLSTASSTSSISSSIFEYRKVHGRTYHREMGNAQYWGANDEKQSEFLDINHHALTLGINGKLHLAPLEKEKVQKVIDIGTGTGIWAMDFADEYPGSEVIGTDISPIQPSWVPPNLKFEIEDCTQEWTFPADHADYIHMRWLVGSIPDWDKLFSQAYRCCRPDGWVESFEPSPFFTSDDGTVKEESALGQWGKFFIEGGKKFGMNFTIVEDDVQVKAMEAAGFVDIQTFEYKTPVGGWPKDTHLKELGHFGRHVALSDTEGVVLFMANTLGWTEAEVQGYIAHFRKEINSGKYHPYYRQRVVWGRKPPLAD
ncbi:hypothetical protein FALCPG4_008603 [Fusarium falciforme]